MPRTITMNPFKNSKKTSKLQVTTRSYYNDKEKPQWDALLNKAIKGYARVETRSYDAFAENGEKTSTETIYYDKKGNRLASVFNVRSKSGNHNSIKTADAEYFDWDMDGNIDCKDFKITG